MSAMTEAELVEWITETLDVDSGPVAMLHARIALAAIRTLDEIGWQTIPESRP